MDRITEMFQFTYWDDEISCNKNAFLHQNLKRELRVTDFRVVSESEELKEVNNNFPKESVLQLCKWEMIIPVNRIRKFDINEGMMINILQSKYKNELLKMIENSRKVSWTANFDYDSENLHQLIQCLPPKWHWISLF